MDAAQHQQQPLQQSPTQAQVVYDLRKPRTRVVYLDGTRDLCAEVGGTAETCTLFGALDDIKCSVATVLQLLEFDVRSICTRSVHRVQRRLCEQATAFHKLLSGLRELHPMAKLLALRDSDGTHQRLRNLLTALQEVARLYGAGGAEVVPEMQIQLCRSLYHETVESVYGVGWRMAVQTQAVDALDGVRISIESCVEIFLRTVAHLRTMATHKAVQGHTYVIVCGLLRP
uniref:Uncharacterized protein n=1 Tax=Lygus hesperus TaxID=30085 RepID=A0A0A9W533_LYGHE